MKKAVVLLILMISINLSAQSSFKYDVDVIQSLYGKTKTDLVKECMGLSDTENVAFQKVYDDYETERKVLGEKKIEIINDYGTNYSTLTDSKADELIKATLKNNLDYEKLYNKTYTKAKKAIGAINAAKFIQLEVYLQTTVRVEIQDSIPFIGELDKTKVN
ncbi:hypothetical protein [Flavobacterium aquidurense]|uniref:hypothetical protein n=1 Tax=Flavobacterium aquidurense TaxID=362413 RepID=UPI00371996C1